VLAKVKGQNILEKFIFFGKKHFFHDFFGESGYTGTRKSLIKKRGKV